MRCDSSDDLEVPGGAEPPGASEAVFAVALVAWLAIVAVTIGGRVLHAVGML